MPADMGASIPAAVTVGATTAGITAGMPPHDVILWAVMGALVAVWLDRHRGEALSWRWLGRALGMIFVSGLSGIAGSAVLVAMPDMPLVGMLAKAPQWTLAFAIAALIHLAGPAVYRRLLGVFKGEVKSEADHGAR